MVASIFFFDCEAFSWQYCQLANGGIYGLSLTETVRSSDRIVENQYYLVAVQSKTKLEDC